MPTSNSESSKSLEGGWTPVLRIVFGHLSVLNRKDRRESLDTERLDELSAGVSSELDNWSDLVDVVCSLGQVVLHGLAVLAPRSVDHKESLGLGVNHVLHVLLCGKAANLFSEP